MIALLLSLSAVLCCVLPAFPKLSCARGAFFNVVAAPGLPQSYQRSLRDSPCSLFVLRGACGTRRTDRLGVTPSTGSGCNVHPARARPTLSGPTQRCLLVPFLSCGKDPVPPTVGSCDYPLGEYSREQTPCRSGNAENPLPSWGGQRVFRKNDKQRGRFSYFGKSRLAGQAVTKVLRRVFTLPTTSSSGMHRA